MQTITTTSGIASIALFALTAAACSGTTPIPEGNTGGTLSATGGTSSGTGGTPSDASGGSGLTTATGGSGPATGGFSNGTGGSTVSTGGFSSGAGTGGSSGSSTGGTVSTSGSGGTSTSTGGFGPGSGGTAVGTGGSSTTGGTSATGGTAAATGGSGGMVDTGPFAARMGSFKMLVYSITKAFKHDSIGAGQAMLQDIAKTQGFEIKVATDNSEITATGLANYEMVFFMNCTGDIFNDTEQKAYETWITTKNGAYAGTHSATDTESGWSFYKELTGQYYDLHDNVIAGTIQWQQNALDFIAVKGLPSPWQRNEEWYKFNSYQTWSAKAGFKVLSMVTTSGGGTRPVSYIREFGNYRAFYTSLGHESSAFQDANVKKHVAAGIMWAVRREALLK